ncbi:MAG: aminoacyl-tRNA hydrolase [Phycisphaerales bacterium]|nr:aminoacyl-tRNA hydrolase [Phycisphaerales bacterium]
MKLIVGLGNPGSEYENTRHNAGFMVLDELARRHAGGAVARGRFHAATLECMIGHEKVLLAKPTTFMNKSGLSVGEAVRFYKLEPAEDMLIVVDDLYIPLGALRLRPKGGDGGHNGLADVARAVGGDAYARLRVGVDAKPEGGSQVGYVLGRFTKEQAETLQPALKRAADAAECWVGNGTTEAMNRFNTPEVKKPKARKPKPSDAEASKPSESNSSNQLERETRPVGPTEGTPSDQPQGASEAARAGHQQPKHSAKDS